MEDIIDIIVTETTNLITITSSGSDEVIDVNIIDNREDITLNVTPTVVEININSLTGNFGVAWGQITGTLSNQTDLNTALGLKADLVGGKVPSSQLPSYVDDVVEVANYAALPATGETGKIYVTLDTNKIYRWSGSAYIEIVDSTAVWGAITGTLSSQTDLQTALDAKFDDPTGDTTQYIAGDGSLITFPVAGQSGTLVREVRNTTGATLTKGTIVYISGATGNKPTVSKAIATGDSTSAQTFGMCQANISNNSNGYVVCVGDLGGLDTSALTEGVQLYLSSTTAGTYTTTKQVAPAHLVYIGVVTRSHPTQGQIEVKIQNGYELDEIHDVLISSKANNDGLFYESSTSLWKNKSIATVLGYTPEQPLTFSSPLTRTTNTISIPAASGSVNGYLSSTDWTTFNGKQVALSGTGLVKSTAGTITYDTNTYALDSAVVHNTGAESVGGIKTFSSQPIFNSSFIIKNTGSGSVSFGGNTTIWTSDSSFNILVGTATSTTRSFSFLYGSNVQLTLPSSDGTLALTSQLSSYLPLSGGTLTGALSGTSATFSSTVQTTNIGINFAPQTDRLFVYNGSGTNVLITAQQDGTGELIRLNGNSGANRFNITQAGAATFSSSVTAGASFLANTASLVNYALGSSGANFGQIFPSTSTAWSLGYGGSSSTIGTPVLTWNSSNNVGIGTTLPTALLTVAGTSDLAWSASTSKLQISRSGTVARLQNYDNGSGSNISMAWDGGNILIGTQTDYGQKFVITGNAFLRSGNPRLILDNIAGASSLINILFQRNDSNVGGFGVSAGDEIGVYNSSSTLMGYYQNSTGAYIAVSDKNKKKDFEECKLGLNEIMKLKPTLYRMKNDLSDSQKQLGFIAQEVKEIIPQSYQESGDFVGLNYNPIVAALTKAIQELKSELDTLKNK